MTFLCFFNCTPDKVQEYSSEQLFSNIYADIQIVQLAELIIDTFQLKQYWGFLKEEIGTSVRIEPGVLSLYVMADSKSPNKITVFEKYANQKAYASHIESSHFQKYKIETIDIVESLELIRVDPISIARK